MPLKQGVRPWRLKDKQATAGAGGFKNRKRAAKPEGFEPRKVPKHEAAKATLEVQKTAPTSISLGLFDPRGRPNISIEDLREDVISILRNSGKTYKVIREGGGPCVATLSKLVNRETKRPQLNTLRAILLACDYDIVFVRKPRAA